MSFGPFRTPTTSQPPAAARPRRPAQGPNFRRPLAAFGAETSMFVLGVASNRRYAARAARARRPIESQTRTSSGPLLRAVAERWRLPATARRSYDWFTLK